MKSSIGVLSSPLNLQETTPERRMLSMVPAFSFSGTEVQSRGICNPENASCLAPFSALTELLGAPF
jgi:hypothetical protein